MKYLILLFYTAVSAISLRPLPTKAEPQKLIHHLNFRSSMSLPLECKAKDNMVNGELPICNDQSKGLGPEDVCKSYATLVLEKKIVQFRDCYPEDDFGMKKSKNIEKVFLLERQNPAYNCIRWASKQKKDWWVVVAKNTPHLNDFSKRRMQFLNCGGNYFNHNSNSLQKIMEGAQQTESMKLCTKYLLEEKGCSKSFINEKDKAEFKEHCSIVKMLNEMKEITKVGDMMFYFTCKDVVDNNAIYSEPRFVHASVYKDACGMGGMWTHKLGIGELVGIKDYETIESEYNYGYGYPLFYGRSLPEIKNKNKKKEEENKKEEEKE